VNEVLSNKTTRHLIVGSVGLGNTDYINDFNKLPAYNEATFIQQMRKLNTLPELSEWAGEMKRDKIDKNYLSNAYNKSLFE
jgi:hypothetical protein